MVTITAFNGPINDHGIAEWLSGCEDTFDNYLSEDSSRSLTDKQKIYAAAHSLSRSPPTDKLASWYTENRRKLETKEWDEFRDAVKDKVLGSGWRLRALRNLYTAAQGSKTLDEYFTALDSINFIISRSSWVPEIKEFEYKCHVLFRALPSLTAQVLKNDISDASFLMADVDEIKDHLKKYEGDSTGGDDSPDVQSATSLSEIASAQMWVSSRAWGMDLSGTQFSDLAHANFPAATMASLHVTRVTVFFNNDQSWPLIQGFDTVFSNGVTVRGPATVNNGQVGSTLNMVVGEYITEVQLSRRTDIYGISSIQFKTSKGQVLFAGGASSDKTTFKAPVGFRVVGFHGAANYYVYTGGAYRYPTTRLGFICAAIAR